MFFSSTSVALLAYLYSVTPDKANLNHAVFSVAGSPPSPGPKGT